MTGRVATLPPTSLVLLPSQAPPGREPIAPLLGWRNYIPVTRLVCRGKSPGTSPPSSHCLPHRKRLGTLTASPVVPAGAGSCRENRCRDAATAALHCGERCRRRAPHTRDRRE